MKVLGIDPGFRSLGLALVAIEGSSRRLLKHLTVHTAASLPFETRLDELAKETLEFLTDAELVGLEDQGDAWHGNEERGTTDANARKVQEVLGMLRGLVISCGKPRVVLRSQTIRAMLGIKGKGKDPIGAMVRHMVEGVPAPGRISLHAVDAIAHAIVAEKKHHASLLVQWQIPGTEKPKRQRVRSYRSVKAARAAGALP
ncbi:MAG TPA: crossover junction endodeoxyribonuclease RuvC [Polyangiaceae bacterium]|jgi:Holliday junction resolvasome RuvABC endonuclease subunit|nr:crossover junction endodeoxyribonuclease RuvC [Polyangiaceae bacterium]